MWGVVIMAILAGYVFIGGLTHAILSFILGERTWEDFKTCFWSDTLLWPLVWIWIAMVYLGFY